VIFSHVIWGEWHRRSFGCRSSKTGPQFGIRADVKLS